MHTTKITMPVTICHAMHQTFFRDGQKNLTGPNRLAKHLSRGSKTAIEVETIINTDIWSLNDLFNTERDNIYATLSQFLKQLSDFASFNTTIIQQISVIKFLKPSSQLISQLIIRWLLLDIRENVFEFDTRNTLSKFSSGFFLTQWSQPW